MEIAVAQGQAAVAGLTPKQQDANDTVELLQAQRKQFVRRNQPSMGTARFLVSIDATQAQVDTLTAALAGIATQRATRSA